MRLVYITTATFPASKASSVQVMQMCAGFAAAGAAVKLVARDPGPERLSPLRLQQYYDVSPTYEIEQRALPRGARPTDWLQARAVWRERADKAYVCYARGRDVLAPLLALKLGASAAVEIHGRPASARERWMLRLIHSHPRGHLVSISEQLSEMYTADLGFDRRFIVAPDGVDLRRFTPSLTRVAARTRLGLVGGPWIVYVGGLYAGRGLEGLFTAMGRVDAKLLVVGGRDENELAEWREMATGCATNAERIQVKRYQPPNAIPTYLAAADVLVMPYSTRTITPSGEDTTAWMSPLKMFEYMATERPIVATDLPAVSAVLQHDRNALLVPPGDAAALAQAISRLLSNADLARRLAEAARRDVANYTWEARARHILGHLDD